MNPLLLTHFDTALEHPNGIKKLRELILTLAMQGKLVPQNPNNQPASELLKEIQTEKARLVAEGKVKKNEALPAVKEEEMPFVIPKGWEWVRLAEVGEINPRNVSDESVDSGFVPMPLIYAEYGKNHQYEIRKWGEIKKGYTHFANGDIGLAKITPCFENAKSCVFENLPSAIGAGTTELHIFRNSYNVYYAQFLLSMFKSSFYISNGIPRMTGSAGQKRVPTDYFANTPLPLPPLAEQKRIVEKIDELFLLCDELETLKQTKDTKRKDLHQSVITEMLEADSQESFQKHFQFLTTHFLELYSVKENVKELRKAVLQLAVMGKLVPQDEKDQPASEFLKEIQAEKARLVADGKIKKSEALSAVKDEEKPFVIPKGWEWVRLGEVLQKYGAGSTPLGGKSVYTSDGIMFLRSQNVWNDGLYLDDVARISKVIHEKMKGTKVIANDILLNITGASIGRSAIFPLNFEEANVSQHVAILRSFTSSIVTYLHKLIISDFFQNLVFKEQVGVSREGLSMSKLSKFPIPLPPLAEQKRIVEKVDQLLALCDELEERIGKAEEKRGEILEGMVRV